MNHKTLRNLVQFSALASVTLALLIIAADRTSLDLATEAPWFDPSFVASSMPLSSPLPTPESEPGPSAAARQARAYISQRERIPVEALDIDYDQLTEYPALGRQFQVVTLVNTRQPGHAYKLLVDLQDGHVVEDISALLKTEARAHQAKYGKWSQLFMNG